MVHIFFEENGVAWSERKRTTSCIEDRVVLLSSRVTIARISSVRRVGLLRCKLEAVGMQREGPSTDCIDCQYSGTRDVRWQYQAGQA